MKAIFIVVAVLLLASCYDITPPATQGPGTFAVKVAWPWDPSTTYAKGDEVTMPEFAPGGPIYESLADGNKGVEPPSLVVVSGDVYGPVGSQLPWIVPTPGWEQYWKLVAIQQ